MAKRKPAGFFGWVAPRFLARFTFLGWADTSRIAFPGEPDRTCDTVAEFAPAGGSGPRRMLDVEFQSEPVSDILDRAGEYAFRLRRELRYGSGREGKHVVITVLVNLTGPEQPDVLDMTEPELDDAGTYQKVVLRTLREEDAAATLAAIAIGRLDPCVLPWIPLMRGAKGPDMMEEWKRLALQEPDSRLRSDYGGIALVFAELAGIGPEWRKALEGWNVRESQQVLEWQEQAREETRLQVTRRNLLRVLELRFQTSVPPDLAAAVTETTDLNALGRWFDAALTADTLDDFRATMRNGAAPGPA